MHNYLIDTLKSLSDLEYQKDCWVARKCPAEYKNDNVHIHLSFLLDDTFFLESPEDEVGRCVDNLKQALAVQTVSRFLDEAVTEVGAQEKDETYIRSRVWPEVVSSSQRALTIILFRNGGQINSDE